MNFSNIQTLFEKQQVLISQLIHNSSLIIKNSETILSISSNNSNESNISNSIIYKTLESICDSQVAMINKIKDFNVSNVKEFEQKVEINFRMLSGDILKTTVCLTYKIKDFYHKFLRDNGYNYFLDFVYPVKFIYEDKYGYEQMLDHKSEMSWFEKFGEDIPLIFLMIKKLRLHRKRVNICHISI